MTSPTPACRVTKVAKPQHTKAALIALTFQVSSNVSKVKMAADKGELYTAARPAPAAQAIKS